MVKRIVHFLILIRWFHELLALFPFVSISILLFLIHGEYPECAIPTFNFVVVAAGVLALMIPGFILNDLIDLPIDRINKPYTLIAERVIPVHSVKRLFLVTLLVAVALSLYITAFILPQWIWISVPVLLLSTLYDIFLKRMALVGNIAIALLGAGVPLVLLLLLPSCLEPFNAEALRALIIVYTGFLFFITIPRELSLDISDMEGDRNAGCRTLPLIIGIKASKIVVNGFIGLAIGASFIAMKEFAHFTWVLAACDVVFTYFAVKLWFVHQRAEYIRLGRFLWIGMICGLLGCTVVTYLILRT
ncbi:MAG: hypothetical protein A3D92_03525 [Bacteroidetes bacterium RIFCSPHIGHO2_02_FULL_44_7]|nr:MAG: hypothetical protein A3D92_03525 [Bacteroidetes bacterium RIFCSPHIGHO2_02_FULL_44_7]